MIDDIVRDHEEMIQSALDDGLSEEDLIERFGEPSKLADDLSAFEQIASEVPVQVEYSTLKTFTPDKAYLIELKFVSEDVVIEPSPDQNIYIDYKGRGDTDKYDIRFDEDKLYIKAPDRKGILSLLFLNRNTLTFRIRLPLEHRVSDFKLSVINGDTKLSNLSFDKTKFKTINGDGDMTSMTLGETKMNTVNGDLSLVKCKTTKTQISLISGDLTIDELDCETSVEFDSVSGDINLDKVTCEACDISTVSGDVRGTSVYPKVASFNTISGDVRIKNEEHKPMEIRKKTSLSGSINLSI